MTYLDRALELAERGRATTRPNPVVGAVVVQSLLLEGGPALVAPTIAGGGVPLLGPLPAPVELSRMQAGPIGEDVLLSAYVHEP
jgi:hypothetical protein